MARIYRYVVGPVEAGERVDRYLVRHLPSTISRSMIQRGIRHGIVTVDERAVRPNRTLHHGEVVVVRCEWLPAQSQAVMVPQPIPLEVVYEDAALLVVNKPAGLVTHPAPGHWDGTLVNAILWHLEQQAAKSWELGAGSKHSQLSAPSSQPLPPRAGIVHRLDKDTSGLLLVAKTAIVHAELSKQLKSRLISRRYLALAEGIIPLDHGTINAAIGRHHVHRKEMTVRHLGGRSAVSHYRVIKRYNEGLGVRSSEHKPASSQLPTPSSQPRGISYSVVDVSLETGRTHQIRVHLAHIGHPVLGDTTYGHRAAGFWAALGIPRQMLHAYHLTFVHPQTRQPITLSAPVPPEMAPWISTLAVV